MFNRQSSRRLEQRWGSWCSIAGIIITSIALAACGGSSSKTDGNSGTTAGAAQKLKVALILPGRINDQGWDTIAFNGLQKVKKQFGAEVAYTESVGPADQAARFRQYASQGYNVIIGMGGQYADGAKAVSTQFPKVKFAVVGGNVGDGKNVSSFNARQEQTFYLSGLIAAKLSKTKKVAFLSGIKLDNTVRGELGFKQGAEAGGANVQSIYTGDFEDVNKAKEAVTAVLQQGADVVQVDSNAANIGAIDAAESAHKKAIGVYGDLTKFGPTTVVTNLVPAMDEVIVKLVEQAKAGDWGKFYLYGFNDIQNLASFTPYNTKTVDPATAKKLEAMVKTYQRKLASGKLTVKGP